MIRLLGRPPAHLGRADRRLGAPPGPDRARRGHAPGVHEGHRQVHDRDGPGARQAQGRQDRARQARPVPGLRARDHREPQGLLVLVARGPGLRLRDLEEEGGQEPAGVGRQGADRVAARLARGRARTRASGAPRSRSPASAAAPGAPSAPSCGWSQIDEGKWRVEFDEEWAKEPPKGESEEERAEAEASTGAAPTAANGEAAEPAAGEPRRRRARALRRPCCLGVAHVAGIRVRACCGPRRRALLP